MGKRRVKGATVKDSSATVGNAGAVKAGNRANPKKRKGKK